MTVSNMQVHLFNYRALNKSSEKTFPALITCLISCVLRVFSALHLQSTYTMHSKSKLRTYAMLHSEPLLADFSLE